MLTISNRGTSRAPSTDPVASFRSVLAIVVHQGRPSFVLNIPHGGRRSLRGYICLEISNLQFLAKRSESERRGTFQTEPFRRLRKTRVHEVSHVISCWVVQLDCDVLTRDAFGDANSALEFLLFQPEQRIFGGEVLRRHRMSTNEHGT